MEFPDDFLWGTATSAYQVEGSPLADGAGPSIWHRFAHTPGLVHDGATGDVACDHYRRYAEDVALMRRLGTNAYRFSVSWSRVLPRGRASVNPAGLDFYERLVDALLAHGIEPMVTLYHWDLPAALDDLGGWLNPDVARWFAEYAAVVFRRLDDRVTLWATLNEPWVVTDGGYLHGALAPGHRNRFEAPIASHHLLRAHAEAVKAYRAEGRHRIGIVVNLEPKHAASDDPADRAATRRADAYM
ncbi:MAG TPA: family 1 glycosylhydrolase, partial [Candidatus Tectomicrobia bacterium]|nr:family 1 glycosylhydrolase [Candidatus Tectomicrobia bacterium]